jgi:probable rRNA maturation factor
MVSPSTSISFTPKVSFFFDQVKFFLAKRTGLKKFIEQLFKKEGRKLNNLTYVFCTDKKLLEINRQFLNHDYFTDIITFDLSENHKSTSAEIYISIDRVRDNAINHDESFQSELHRVIFHGALHLCGYGDKTKVEKLKMREREDYYLSKYRK